MHDGISCIMISLMTAGDMYDGVDKSCIYTYVDINILGRNTCWTVFNDAKRKIAKPQGSITSPGATQLNKTVLLS